METYKHVVRGGFLLQAEPFERESTVRRQHPIKEKYNFRFKSFFFLISPFSSVFLHFFSLSVSPFPSFFHCRTRNLWNCPTRHGAVCDATMTQKKKTAQIHVCYVHSIVTAKRIQLDIPGWPGFEANFNSFETQARLVRLSDSIFGPENT